MNIFDSLSNLYNRIFSSGSTDNSNFIRRTSPAKVDLTFDDTMNVEFFRNLYHNTMSGFKLGAALCYNPIAVPLSFMGFPHFDLDDWDPVNQDFWRERLDFYNDKYILAKKNIQLMCHRDGTIIIWPWFDASVNYVRWKFIKPEYVSRKTTDPDTDELTGLVTSINYLFQSLNGKLYNYVEERIYTKKTIIINRTGAVPPELNTQDVRRNPIGILPIIFANNREPGEFEGRSDLGRMVPYVKAYSEINLRAHENEKNQGPKLVQKVSNADKWLATNSHLGEPSEMDISSVDFVLNIEGEDTKFEIPTGLNANATELMRNDFHIIVEQSSIPEICWGLKTTGNHATSEEQMGLLFAFVMTKQTQADPSYLILMNATNKLEAMANMQTAPEGLKAVWGDLSTLTELEKATIFSDYATGFEKLLASNAIDLQSVHTQLYELTNGMVTSDYDQFVLQVKEYGLMKAFLAQDDITQRETQQTQEQTTNKGLSKEGEYLKNLYNTTIGDKGSNGHKTRVS